MEEKRKVKITLGKNGSVRVEAFNFKGGSCEEATAFLDKLFGGNDQQRNYKDSYWENKETISNGLPSEWCG